MGQFKNTDPKDTPEDEHDKSEDDYCKPEPKIEAKHESVSSSSTAATSSSSSSAQPPPSSPSSPSPAFIARHPLSPGFHRTTQSSLPCPYNQLLDKSSDVKCARKSSVARDGSRPNWRRRSTVSAEQGLK
ncbi:hypothetical protein AGABI2DRAFT_116620 [Agaricus bisporus var. bisporus H97]|uniref:hypothetical protein n=1 Tax=Agaricus bisporus var. bisporus (strain H97 / ATCC MYA-4626 / FGSC 10389) TaxID=936046 RepID=UPI00029F7C00|nr:hypothetical protein AGABI2DRAFT_116620 [Agaricus bisporus var. bisporus H97]EKV49586.1 hypothetical protein AGABI2DRAFT_116620 [Agaricus bisporus var. bisporus H97]